MKYKFVKRRHLTVIVSLVAVLMIVGWVWGNKVWQVGATDRTLTSSANFAAGEYSGLDVISREGEMKLEADGSWLPRIWKTPDLTLTDGSAIVSGDAGTFLLVGRDMTFYKYLPAQNNWKSLAAPPYMANTGSDLVQLGNYIYAEFGGYQKAFARYSILGNSWQVMADMPDLVQGGASLQTDGTLIYALRGASSYDFWKYNPSTNLWSVLTAPPMTIGAGADLIFDDSTGTPYLYTPRGLNTTSFYRYNIGASNWSTLPAMPTALNDTGNMTKKGNYIYSLKGNSTSFYRYDIGGTWQTLSNAPQTSRYVGVTYNQQEDLIYVFRGNGSYDWWKYDSDTGVGGRFLGSIELPATPGNGADLVYENGYVYYRRGNNNASFYRMGIGGTWQTLDVLPASVNDDNKGVAVGNSLYYFRGSGQSNFWQYVTTGVGWTAMMNTPATVSYGASLVYPGGDFIYATRGGVNRSFWRYKIGVGETWDDGVVADLPVGSETGYGSRLVTDGTDIYMVSGMGISNFLKYSITSNTWTVLGQAPFSPYWGTDLVYYNGKIYAQSGYYKTEVWEYDITSGQWRNMTPISSTYVNDVGPYNGGSLAVDSDNGVLYSISGQNVLNLWSFQLSNYDYKSSGTWTSEIIDLSYVQSFVGLGVSATVPVGTGVTWESQSSSDNVTWSGWSTVSGGSIVSLPGRYIRLRATLMSNGARDATPVIQSVTVSYVGDDQAPEAIGEVSGLSQAVGGIGLTSGSSYPYNYPKFSWSAPGDNGLGVNGYYVYFGLGETADPVVEGNFQTASNYVVTIPMTAGTYYLRLVTEDLAGNRNAAETKFVYNYNGVLPLSVGISGQTDLALGVGVSTTVADGKITLQSKPGFWEQKRVSLGPSTFRYGASFAYVSTTDKLYTFRGNNSNSFYEYDVATDTWSVLPNAPGVVYTGGDLVEGPDGYLYGLPGINSNTFWRYDIGSSTWSDEAAADAPLSFNYGSSMIYDGSQYIYALRGANDDALMRYDTYTDYWDTLTNVDFGAPVTTSNNNVYVGGDLAFDGDNLYAIQGNYLTGFAAYSIITDSWQILPNLPSIPYDGSQIVYDSVTNAIYYISGWTNPFLYKYNLADQSWEKLPDAPMAFSGGAALRLVGREIYALRGGSSNVMWVYDIDKQSWLTPTRGMFGPEFRGTDQRQFAYGAQIIKGDSDNYYLTRGNYDNLFVRYNETSGEVTKMANAPGGYYTGSAITYVPGQRKIYSIASQYLDKLWKYDIDTDSWSEDVGSSLPIGTSYGSSLEFDGTDKIYWIAGGNRRNLYVYDLGSTAVNKWSALGLAPANLGYGAHLVYKGGYLYTLRGANIADNPFYRYDPDPEHNSWETMAPLPIDANNDATLVDSGGDTMIACKAENTSLCYQYSISEDSWTSIADAPANIYQGGAAASDDSERMLVIAGYGGTNTYNNGLYSYIFSNENTSFVSSGQYQGASLDLGEIYRFANLEVDYNLSRQGTFTVETRTSDDNVSFSVWTAVSEEKTVTGGKKLYKINSPPRRYIQLRIILLSDNGVHSPEVDGYQINYYRDVDPPSGPASVNAFTDLGMGTTLVSGVWNASTAPYFGWSGADDGFNGSGVVGYYVYYGLGATADPVNLGTYTTGVNFTGSGMATGSYYYLRIKAKDDAGNVSTDVGTTFVYGFDASAPSNPVTITSDPQGYTATNSYTFTWSGAGDTGAGIEGYYYKTGAVGVSEVYTVGTSVAGITAYQTGTNTFYVKTKDLAGNVSNYTTASYYYSADAPGAPRDLKITYPETGNSNSLNEFAFSWSTPDPGTYYGQQSGLRYYYSFNETPSVSNVNEIGLSLSYLSKGAYATRKGTNTLYVVAKDEAGNIDYRSFASIDFVADTSAPGMARNIDISDVSIKETSSWRLALSWDTPEATGSGVAAYKVYRSTTSGASCSSDLTDFSYISSATTTSFVDVDLTQVKYNYCVKTCDSTNECGAVSDTVGLLPDGRWRVAPSLTSGPEVAVKTKSATATWSTSRTSSSFVKYGKESGNYGEEVGTSDQVSSHSINLTGLDPGTSYYYQVLWTDEDGNTGLSDEAIFVTNPAPVVSTVKVTDIGLFAAYVNFGLNHATKATIQYGKTVNYGSLEVIDTGTNESTYTVKLDNLEDGTTYHLKIIAEDEEGNIFDSDDYEFETLPMPKLSEIKVQQVRGEATATVRVVWKSNTGISSIISYFPTGVAEASKDTIQLTLTESHQMIISDLQDDMDYTMVVKGKDIGGNEAVAVKVDFKTSLDLRPPIISNLNVDSVVNGVGDQAVGKVVVSWDTDEQSTSQVEYGEGTGSDYPSKTQDDSTLVKNHVVTVSELKPGLVYHLRVVTKDKMGNVSQSYDNVVVMPKATKSALDLVVGSLSKSFGFFSNLSQVAK